MVSKSLTFMALLLYSISAQTFASDEGAQGESVQESTASQDENDQRIIYPTLNCELFQDIGCNTSCSVIGSAFGYQVTGTCDNTHNNCKCHVPSDQYTLDVSWNTKFNSKDILQQIKNDENLSAQVVYYLYNPFRTPQEAKLALKSVLSEDQYKNLQPNEQMAATKMVKNGKFDIAAIKKYVADELSKILNDSDNKKLSALNYKSVLLETLEKAKEKNNDGLFNALVSNVCYTRNKSLGDVLTQYLKKNKLEEPATDQQRAILASAIDDYVIANLVQIVDKNKSESEEEAPSLTCLLFNNLGCNTKCSTIASAFLREGTGQCVEGNICQCNLKEDKCPFRAKINSDYTNLTNKILEILQTPFQTVAQTKLQLQNAIYPVLNDDTPINDITPAGSMVSETGELDCHKIKDYVSEKLKPVLQSSSTELMKVNYKSNLKKSLETYGKAEEELQSIIDQVRRTKIKNLNDIVDEYLKTAEIEEEKKTDKDDLADAIGYLTVIQFVDQIEQKKKPVGKKPPCKPSARNARSRSKAVGSKSAIQKSPAISNKFHDEETSYDALQKDRFLLKNFDKSALEKPGQLNERWITNEYNVQYQRSNEGEIRLSWTKGVDRVAMKKGAGRSCTQIWQFENVTIKLAKSSWGDIKQIWDFGNTVYKYKAFPVGYPDSKWSTGKPDMEKLKKYQGFIDAWCESNDFLMQKDCCLVYRDDRKILTMRYRD